MESFLTPEKAPIRSVLKEINANGVVVSFCSFSFELVRIGLNVMDYERPD